jgi:dihydrodipicolinate synthase/N-acetylneuraminate lyase
MLSGIMPIVFVPFNMGGDIDVEGLRRIITFELEGGADAIGINGFASETYKLLLEEQYETARITAEVVDGAVPLIIGMAPGSTEVAIRMADHYAQYDPAALMVLPPNTMQQTSNTLFDFYTELGVTASVPIMVQQAPHIPAYAHTRMDAQTLAQIHDAEPNVNTFKIEGPGSAERITELAAQPYMENAAFFGGGGGITLLPELRAGANGLIPGVGFNDYFHKAWAAWKNGDEATAEAHIKAIQPLVSAVSGPGHEFSLHARKYLMQRAGVIEHPRVRRPTVGFTSEDAETLYALVDGLDLRIAHSP